MNVDEAVRLINHGCTIMDGWKVNAICTPLSVYVTVSAWCKDSDAAFKGNLYPPMSWVNQEHALPSYLISHWTSENLSDWLWAQVKGLLLHEAAEWFVWQGERPYYPHTSRAPAVVSFPV